jgi:hypothetical protein
VPGQSGRLYFGAVRPATIRTEGRCSLGASPPLAIDFEPLCRCHGDARSGVRTSVSVGGASRGYFARSRHRIVIRQSRNKLEEPEIMQKTRHRRSIIGAVISVVMIMIALCGPTSTTSEAASPRREASVASPVQILQAVAAAPSIKSVPSDINPAVQHAGQDAYLTILDGHGCDPAFSAATVGSCLFGDPKGSKTIVLLGDSHAGMWFPGFDAMAKRAHWKLVVLMKAVCPAVDLSFWNWTMNSPYTACDEWHQYASNRINKMDPAVVVFTSWWHGDGILPNGQTPTLAQWQLGLQQAINSVSSPGTKKVVLGDIAYLAQTGPDCLTAHETNVQACSTPASQAAVPDHEQTLQAAAQATGATYISTTPWLCTATCTAVIGNYEVYADSSEITNAYAGCLQGAIAEALRPVMAQATPHTRRP